MYRIEDDPKWLRLLGMLTAALAGVFAVAAAAARQERWAVAAAIAGVGSAFFFYIADRLSNFRRLTTVEHAGLLRTLAQLPPVDIRVAAAPTTESRAYARQILNVLREAQWPARGVYRTEAGNRAAGGLFLAIPNSDAPPDAARWLVFAFEGVGIRVGTAEKRSLQPHEIELLVGRRPAG